jgi:hypothetical protein
MKEGVNIMGKFCIMKRKTLSLMLIAAMLLSLIAGLTSCGKGNQAELSGAQKAETFTVEEGQTALSSETGTTIDFGCLLEAGEEVTIQKVTPASLDQDVDIYAYDFKLSSGQPEGVVELTIPYDDTGLDTDEELLSVCGKYLNEQTGQWEDVFYTVDAEANKVHILTDHLSTYSVFKVRNEGKRSEKITDVNAYAAYMTTKQAEQLLNTYAEQGASWQDFGDGSYYKIVCSNDETGSTYINGSYFVRWSTGEANIAGAKFVFSADGTSFTASMRDHNDKEWGSMTCQK